MLRKKALWGFVPVLMAGLMFLGGCHKPSPEKIADRIIDELVEKLDLTSVQKDQLNATKVEILAKVAEMKKNKDAFHGEVIAELQKDVLDQGQLKKMVTAHKSEMDVMADLLIDRLAKFHATLTPEQKTKLVELLKEREKCRNSCFFDH